MTIDARKLAFIALLALGAAGTWWLARRAEPVAPPPAPTQARVDYIVENFHDIAMDTNGRPKYELRATRLVHNAGDGSNQLTAPYLIQYAPGRAPTHVRGRTGFMPAKSDWIRFTGNVSVTHGRDAGGAGGELHTETFTVQLEQ